MTWKVGDTYRFSFPTFSGGVPADADSTPTGELIVNGSATAATVTIENVGTGRYRGNVSLAGLSLGDAFEVEITAVIGGTTYVRGEGEQRISITADGVPESQLDDGTKLDAVNEMLEAIGLPAVTALDPGGTTEEAEAEAILDRYTDRVMDRGWACNTADERTFSPSSGEIDMSGVLNFFGSKYGDPYTISDGKLYDPVNDSSTAFTSDVVLTDVVYSLTFDQIPGHVQQFIVAEAKLALVRYKRQDVEQIRIYAAERQEARREAMSVDARQQNVNITQTLRAATTRGFPHGRRR